MTSDHHFGHANIIKYSNRPFENVDEMNETMIKAWNAKIPKGSIVYHLGDFAFMQPDQIRNLRRRLNGTIRLVKGNHDRMLKGEVRNCFEWIRDYYESKTEDGIKVVMCHYPFLTWNKSHHGSWNLHGHCHGSLQAAETTRMDVGIDTTQDYAPYSFAEVEAFMKKRAYKPVDHHHEGQKKDNL